MPPQVDQKSRQFTVDYRAPFGGIDSTAYASAIDEHDFAAMNGIYIENNKIKPVGFQELLRATFDTGGESYMGYIPLTSYFNNVSDPNTLVGYIISDENLYPVTGTIGALALGTPVPYIPAMGGGSTYFHFIVIDDIETGVPSVYWTGEGWYEIWGYDAVTSTLSLTTNYCGGGVLGLLNNQLLNLGGVSHADGNTPNRISWSAPGEYGQFQPYDVISGTGNYAAGFNDLPSTSDIITGFAAIGTVGYIFRYQGITQMSPTGTGIVPFTFNHLWASQLGIGSVLPNSICQYGSSVAFAANDGFFTLGLGGLANLGRQANSYIFKTINTAPPLSGSIEEFTLVPQAIIVPYILGSPDLFYIVAVPVLISSVYYWHVMGIRLADSKTLDFGFLEIPLTIPEFPTLQLAFIPSYAIETGTAQPSFRIKVLLITGGERVGTGTGTFVIDNLFFEASITGSVTFKKEQLGFLQQPTINKLLVLGSLVDTTQDGTISWSIDGGLTFNDAFKDTTITAGVGNPGLGIIDDIVADGIQTLERPQLALMLTNVEIAEAWFKGTFADYEPI
ncbi:MAG TPA: hypothetical protein VGF75_08045 [Candidatus Saccharimonadales bacterium]|jgi:hypothetical protein